MENLEIVLQPGVDEERAGELLASVAGREGAVRVVLVVGEPGAGELRRVGRLALVVRRAGGRVVLRGAGERWRVLLELTGLAEALPVE
ncbi:hypothetical protein Kpho02_62540 [Kitasatospora phosalacinea]|uniref:STAS domain-containing protein n=1 Tax=Kitasatospora phosalacinea TaxID=2065 RepID=A0A9W6QFD7_9ACTN|nr:hypothetical protein [Kitasatospora phosalacinea]GLW73956.1 hypothetical protein Kpho02_62540 [Kitasatospora phosalacinea]